MDENKYTLTEHLGELRGRLIKSFLAIVLTTAVCAVFAPDLLKRAVEPLIAVLRDKNRVETVVIHPHAERRRALVEMLEGMPGARVRANVESIDTLGEVAKQAIEESRPVELVLMSTAAIGLDGALAGEELEGIDPAPWVAYLVTDAKAQIVSELTLEGASLMMDPPSKGAVARTLRRAAAAAGKTGGGEKLVVLSPLDPFFAYLKIALVCGLFLACPIWLFQAWRFVEPGLYDKEKGVVLPAVLSGSVLFLAGGAFAYFLMFPVMFNFLINNMMPASVTTSFTVDNYLNLLLLMTLAFGIIFELPLVLTLAVGVGLVKPETLIRFRKYAIIGAFVVGGVLTPTPDPFSQLMMAVPLVLFYEIGIILGRLMNKRRRARLAAEERALEKVS